MTAAGELVRRIRQAQRRLFLQDLFNTLTLTTLVALASTAIVWVSLPLASSELPSDWRAYTLAGLLVMACGISLLRCWLRRKSQAETALILDQRFALSERVTTAWNLDGTLRQSPAGQALLADVERQLADLKIGPRFPLRLRWSALLVPVEVVGLVLLFLFPPSFTSNVQAEGKNEPKLLAKKENDPEKIGQAVPRKPFIKPTDRPNKSDELKQLETELEKLLNQINPEEKNAQVAREKVQKIDELADKLRKLEKENLQKFAQLQEQMRNLEKVEKAEMKSGPANEMQENLKQGEMKKAQQDVDRLQKKIKNKELTADEKQQLAEQMQDLQDRLEKLSRDRDAEKKLKDLIAKAKQEGRDAEALERELKELQRDLQENADLQQMADKIAKAKEAMQKGDIDEAAQQLQELAKQFGDAGEQLEDLEDVKEYLQRLKEARKGQCKACQGECEGGEGEPKWTKNAKGGGRGAGERPDNPDAQSNSEDQRIRSDFNPLGRKYYGGSTDGPAFNKRTTAEMAGEIQQAVQEAPDAVEVQRLPRAARDMVREYFERLGGQSGGPAKKP